MSNSSYKCDKYSIRSKWCQSLLIFFMMTWSFVYFLCVFHLNGAIKYDIVENNRFHQRNSKKCIPRTKISFLMTHGTSSNLVRNMLLRYGYEKDLNFVFGKEDSTGELKPLNVPFTLDYFNNASKSDFPWHQILLEQEGYDMSALYMKWNKTAISNLLGPDDWFFSGDDAFYATILKRPEAKANAKVLSSVVTTLEGHPDIEWHQKQTSDNIQLENVEFKRNQQIFDLGLLEEELYNNSKIHEYINCLETDFDFVMIEELFHESLVLLADYLCLPLEYMVGFNSSSFQSSSQGERDKSTLEELKRNELILNLNDADELMYKTFYQKILELIKKYGSHKMSKKVSQLKFLNEKMKQECKEDLNNVSSGNSLRDHHIKNSQVLKKRFSIDQCKLLSMEDNELLDFVYKEQKKKFLSKQRNRFISKLGSKLELSFERKFLWG